MSRRYLVAAKNESTKTIASSEDMGEWIEFHPAGQFASDSMLFVGQAVFAKCVEYAYKRTKYADGRKIEPGFAVVGESQLEAIKGARHVEILGVVEVLDKMFEPLGMVEDIQPENPAAPAEPEVFKELPTEMVTEERFDCPRCARKGFTEDGLKGHLGWHDKQKERGEEMKRKRAALEV